MKIGILTFHRACNYGAILQTYALQKAVGGMNTDCEIIDYRNEEIEKSSKIFYIMSEVISPKHILAALLNAPLRFLRKMEFRGFAAKHLKLSRPVLPPAGESCDELFDRFIVGSDQVWNDRLTNNDKMYFLNCIRSNRKKYSYAASFGFSTIPELLRTQYRTLLSEFNKVSVREETGQKIIKDLLDYDAGINVDPTFLINRMAWEELCTKRKEKGKYILIYSINRNRNLMDFAKELGRRKGIPIRYILMDITNIKKYRGMKSVFSPSPGRFLSLIRDADTVITNSFHGTVFSIIFQKNFYAEVDYGTKYNDRVASLLKHLDLTDRIILSAEITGEEKPVNWDKTYTLLEKYRSASLDYLKDIVS